MIIDNNSKQDGEKNFNLFAWNSLKWSVCDNARYLEHDKQQNILDI